MSRWIAFALSLVAALVFASRVMTPVVGANERLLTVDHYVRLKSTAPAINGQMAHLYVRERLAEGILRTASLSGRVVLFVHGAGTPGEVAFDVPYGDYSWMAYLASAGFDAFAMDMTGYGRSTKPSPMEDPCNLTRQQQTALVPALLEAPCAPSYTGDVTTIGSDWNDINAVVDYIRALRHVERVSLVAWSQGGARAGGFAVLHPDKVDRLVMLAPASPPNPAPNPPATPPPTTTAPPAPFSTQSHAEFVANWDRQVGCPAQYDQAVSDAVWTEMQASDPVGATWGTGVRRSSNARRVAGGWDAAALVNLKIPTLLVSGAHDKQVDPANVRQLHSAIGATDKVFVDLGCSSHNALWEKNHLVLFEASRQWLTDASVNGAKTGTLRLGYGTAGNPGERQIP
jgi:pimeloyl-ACP methyl ester carboxylesterase